MFQPRLMLGLLVAGGLASLACSGLPMGSSGGEIQVAKTELKKGSKPKNRSKKRKNEYLVKVRPGVTELKVGRKTISTSNSRLDKDLSALTLDLSREIHKFAAKDQELASYLGLNRTIYIKTRAPERKVRQKLANNPDVEWVEPVIELYSASQPNDPYWSHQWHMQMLNVPKAWETTMGEGVVVAVVDTGVSVGEDGFYKMVPGYDFIDNDSDPQDLNGHGTHVAGTIGQATNNGVGVAGVAPKVSIMPVRVLGATGGGTNDQVAAGIVWAADNGANIINLSLGSPFPSETVADACAYAYNKGVTLIAATGNDGNTSPDGVSYPAAFDCTIAVGSVDANKRVAFYSNQGSAIDLVAPGGDTSADSDGNGFGDGVLQQTVLDGQWGYQFMQGTSMAAPHVAGVAALVYANGVRDPDQIRRVLTRTADDLGDRGFDNVYGHGLVNPVAALGAGRVAAAGKKGRGRRGGGSGDLAIEGKRIKKVGENRAVVAWKTNEPSTTMIKGPDGFEEIYRTRVRVHRVTVSGQPGQQVTYTIRSKAGKDTVTDTVKVRF